VEIKPEELAAQLVEHLRARRKIDAIKTLREAKRYGLREAKLLVEQLEKSLEANPDAARSASEAFVRTLPAPEPVDTSRNLPCSLVLLLIFGAALAFLAWQILAPTE
jgi:hypothetical protein